MATAKEIVAWLGRGIITPDTRFTPNSHARPVTAAQIEAMVVDGTVIPRTATFKLTKDTKRKREDDDDDSSKLKQKEDPLAGKETNPKKASIADCRAIEEVIEKNPELMEGFVMKGWTFVEFVLPTGVVFKAFPFGVKEQMTPDDLGDFNQWEFADYLMDDKGDLMVERGVISTTTWALAPLIFVPPPGIEELDDHDANMDENKYPDAFFQLAKEYEDHPKRVYETMWRRDASE